MPSKAPDGVLFRSSCSHPRFVSFSGSYLFHFGLKSYPLLSLIVCSTLSDTLRLLKGCSIRPLHPHFVKDDGKRMLRKGRCASKTNGVNYEFGQSSCMVGDQMTRNTDKTPAK